MDDGRIDVSTDHSESYTFAEIGNAGALPLFIVMLLYNFHTQSKPDDSGLTHCNTVALP